MSETVPTPKFTTDTSSESKSFMAPTSIIVTIVIITIILIIIFGIWYWYRRRNMPAGCVPGVGEVCIFPSSKKIKGVYQIPPGEKITRLRAHQETITMIFDANDKMLIEEIADKGGITDIRGMQIQKTMSRPPADGYIIDLGKILPKVPTKLFVGSLKDVSITGRK